MEDSDQNIHLKNLSLQQAANEEDALDLLFLGDTNRIIAETPMNQASTRSHCIFTIHLCSKKPGSATVRCSKLHLVDLAGSERVGKTGVGGQILTEAKYINLSLHYLEQVIIALSEKNRSHIPYRNSMMTSVLRDSLGGNCMTTMIATVSVERMNIDESISTCRFAQRVALIKNDALLNEELDSALLIIHLKKEIQSLKEELALVSGEQRSDELTPEEIQKYKAAGYRSASREHSLNSLQHTEESTYFIRAPTLIPHWFWSLVNKSTLRGTLLELSLSCDSSPRYTGGECEHFSHRRALLPNMDELLQLVAEVSICQQQIVEHLANHQVDNKQELAALHAAHHVPLPDPWAQAAKLLPKMFPQDDLEAYLQMLETMVTNEG
nr:kinesin-like protein KIF6 [Misgurnus anguillicaudatus]